MAGTSDTAVPSRSQVAPADTDLNEHFDAVEDKSRSPQVLASSNQDEVTSAPAGGADPPRPTDEQILSFENQLREEQSGKRPLLGGKDPIESLQEEYQDSSHIFVSKVAHICGTYSYVRRTRQDGNCFYRSFIFGLLEALLVQADQATTLAVIQSVKSLEDPLSSAGITKLVYEDAIAVLLELLQAVSNPQDSITHAELLLRLNSEDICNVLVMFVRFAASAHLFQRESHFLPFIIGAMDSCADVNDFRRRYVEVMGEESDHIQVVAVAEAFRVPVEVVYLDNSPGTESPEGALICNTHKFEPPEPLPNAHVPTVTVLYRPGHYDLLY